MNNVKKSATEKALTALVGTQYSINELINSVHMKENRVVIKKNLTIVNDSTNCCPIEETIVTDGTFTVTEGRYVEVCEHDSQYHYIYLHCAEEDWKFKVILDERDLIIEIKEMYTVTQIVEKLKLELVGKQFNLTTVCVSIRRFLAGLPWEEKGETQLDDMEGEDGREYNSMTFFVKSTMEEFLGICISYDSAYLIRDVKVFTKYEE